MASLTSTSSHAPHRSELLQVSGSNVPLVTVNTVRDEASRSPDVQTADAVSLPFLVTSRFSMGDPARTQYHHLDPGQFPKIQSDLGYGASFIVHKAVLGDAKAQSLDPAPVALKRIRPSGFQTRESFRCVVTDLLCLTHPPVRHHPNVVDLLGLGWEISPSVDDYRLWPYLILEYTAIGNLAEFQESHGPLPYRQKETLSQDVASGLLAVHDSNIVHGDIKSENVLVFPDPKKKYIAKISDFGFAILDVDFPGSTDKKIRMGAERTTAQVSSGTRPWTAPEVGKTVSWQDAFKADIYSWGLLVWRVFLDGQNPFVASQDQFEALSQTSKARTDGHVQAWKEQNLVLPVAVSFARRVQPQGSSDLENAFNNSLTAEPRNRDLTKALLPWTHGQRYFSLLDFWIKQLTIYISGLYTGLRRKMPLNRIALYQLQMYHPRLRQQFLRDLDGLGKLSSPLVEDDAMFCPTNIASMTVAEYHICTNNLGLAYNHMVRAARRGLTHAQAIVAQLEPYHGVFESPIDIGDFPTELTIKSGKPPARALKWAFSAACLGSLSALLVLRDHSPDDYQAALRTVRSSRLGGIQALSLWTSADLHSSKANGRMMASPESKEQLMFGIHLRLDELDEWVVAGPRIGRGISALHVASAKGLPQAIRKLIERGEDVNSQMCPERCTPLLLACISGSFEAVQELIKNGADPTIGNEDEETPMHWLSSFDDDQILPAAKVLFSQKSQLSALAVGAAIVAEGFNTDLAMTSGTPLHRAIGKRNIHAVRALLDLGADPHWRNRDGATALGLATKLHLTAIMQLLHSRMKPYKPNQDHGPNLRLFNFAINGATPLALFQIHGDHWLDNAKETLVLLLSFGESLYGYGGEDNFIKNTISTGNYQMTKVLLENGATEHMEKNEVQFGGTTALHVALELGQQHIFMELLKHGAMVETPLLPANLQVAGSKILADMVQHKSNYLHFCAETGCQVFFVREFIRRGLSVNQPDWEWHTPLFLALKAGNLDIASELLKHGARLDEVRDGLTLLGQLAEQGYSIPLERFQWLLEQQTDNEGAKLIANQRLRQSIFHLLAQDKRMVRQPLAARRLVAFFLEQVRDHRLLDLQDVHLDTALHLAVQCENLEMVRALLDAGVKLGLVNLEGKTPTGIAREGRGPKARDVRKLLELHGASPKEKELDREVSDTTLIRSFWKELGFQEQLVAWLDTALVLILQGLRQTFLELFRSDGFLVQENPWKSMTKAVWDFVRMHPAIFANELRTRQFEYSVGEMLQGFVDAVTVQVEGEELKIHLVKPLDRRVRRFPPNLLNELITTMALTPGVGQTSFHERKATATAHATTNSPPPRQFELRTKLGERDGQSRESRGGQTTDRTITIDPEDQPPTSMTTGPVEQPSRKWIRLRRLAEARFIIEKHDLTKDGLNTGDDTGIMVLGDDSDMIRRCIVDRLMEETIIELIDSTDENLVHRATSVAGLETLASALEEHKRSGTLVPPPSSPPEPKKTSSRPGPSKPLSSSSSSTTAPRGSSSSSSAPSPAPARIPIPTPKVSIRTDLSAAEKARRATFLKAGRPHTITHGDELAALLFDRPIPRDVWIYVSVLESAAMAMTFPCRTDNKGNPAKPMDEETAMLAKEFTHFFRI
ncbi:hypothetical protein Z517_11271 [Fonsecaea pedrosoi CBS 271.37]|uniref:Protein kinase domain-containing protein n=1 Tax=Fonsecaea pedrosoi CBS 271.37 TaxID=1442368 RepID=A0A0D2GCY8_9EURO|nr:uncharacterized protein Z517_11271 [Fonsecaea pedrosoi CBS 271.37]KIW76525.1 hypothetical protein Z517_11271 [Fonsecaea pedrosoi CBS 271.37]